jgi:hypothetical protein
MNRTNRESESAELGRIGLSLLFRGADPLEGKTQTRDTPELDELR